MSQSQNAGDVIKNLVDGWDPVSGRNYQIMVNDEKILVPVVRVPSSCLTLNHNNHRLSAQLIDHKSGEDVRSDPTSSKSQEIIGDLLARTAEFGSLKEELKTLKQREPGLITRDGLLINGNTRCVALRQLEQEGVGLGSHMDVAVLGKDINEEMIRDIEVSLQMVKTTHQDYTYVNQLLFIRDLQNQGKSEKAIARAMNWQRRGVLKVQKHVRILRMIEELREMAENGISFENFDTKETHLKDLDNDIEGLIAQGRVADAETLKNTRLLAILSGLNKDQVRIIDEDFLDELKESNSNDPENSVSKILGPHVKQVDPIDEVFDEEEPVKTVDARSLLLEHLNRPDSINEKGLVSIDLETEVGDFVDQMKGETDRLINKGRRESRNEELSVTMRGIRKEISDCLEILSDRVAEEGFKAGDFKYELDKASKELENLQEEYEKLNNA